MTFWRRLRHLGSVLFLAIAALTLGAALLLAPDTPLPPPLPVVPGLGALKGTSGL